MAVAMKQKDLRSDSWNHRGFSPVRMSTSAESELLLKINQGISDEMQERFDELVAKRLTLDLSEEELAELIQLTNEVERLDAERIKYLGELGQLRGRSLSEIMQDLEVHAPACV
jgi:hypothetical protein